ncbi:MAG TPA: hypothetical protein ENI79_02415, partial [Rhodospirillales bacterium]|nr:hypothetical protein [Rhodospirillales bacterium]
MDGPRNLASYLEEFSSLRPLPEKLERNVDTERRVIEAYLSNLSADWVALVRRLCEALPAMAPQTRLSVLIPARLEAFRLPRCLAALEQESRSLRRSDPNVLEVIVLDNRRKSDAPDHTADAIALWTAHAKAESLPVSRVVHVWNDDERFCLPKARKLLADVALMRAIERPTAIGPLYLISEDADVEDIEPNRSAEFVRRFDALPWLDALRGRQDRTPSVLA